MIDLQRAARIVSRVAAGFTLLVAMLLLANWVQTRSVDPLDSPALDQLRAQLAADPTSRELAEQVRALDLLARRAYFVSQWQQQTGAVLLLLGAIVTLAAARLGRSGDRTQADLDAPPQNPWVQAAQSQRRVAVAALVLLAGAASTALVVGRSALPLGAGDDDLTARLAAAWPSFRGPGGNAHAVSDSAPTSWDARTGEGIRWRVEVPLQGYSSPVVWGSRVLLTGADRSQQEVYCFDASSGELRWRHEVSNVPGSTGKVPRLHRDTGFAPSTVATDGERVFAIFPTGDLVGLDLGGTRLWATNLGLPDNQFGHASSLIVHDGRLIVQYDQRSDARLLALDPASGRTLWQVQRTIVSWSSPIVVDTGSRSELILTDSESIASYDPANGELLWRHDCLGGDMGPSAAYDDGWVFAANDYATAVGIRLDDGGSEIVWSWDENLPDTASPLAANGLLFLATSQGDIVCLRSSTGELLWEQMFGGGFYASPILVGELIYAIDLDGVTHIFRAADSYQQVADNEIGEPSACTPAVVDGVLYLRGDRYLYCVEGIGKENGDG